MSLSKICAVILLFCCSLESLAAERWFNPAIVEFGNRLFQQNCAVCHGADAEGTREWKKPDANGNYSPPPLDGNAHAWHHSLPQLADYVKQGGARFGGVMPAFGDKLSNEEVLAVIAYFQSKWSDELYQRWHTHFMQ